MQIQIVDALLVDELLPAHLSITTRLLQVVRLIGPAPASQHTRAEARDQRQ